MIHDFIKMIDNIDFLYGFIYECANLINNLYDYNNYDHLAIKLCSEFIMPIINITKKEHIKEYNEHIKDIIDNLESIKDIYSICSYLMNICCEEYFKLSQVICIFPQSRYKEFHEKIIKSYFNIWYIKFFYLLQKNIKLNKNIYNSSILMNIFMNVYDNSNIDCNKKTKNKIYDLYNNIVLNKFVHSNKYKNSTIFTIYK